MSSKSFSYLIGLVQELCKLPNEAEWVEFKHNNDNPKEIGAYLSALSNSAALDGKPSAYLLWGIEDESHAILGTTFKPFSAKVGNEEMENWLLKLLQPKIHFRFYEIDMNGLPVVLLEIPAALSNPVLFEEQAFIRVGSYRKKLKDHPEKERELWRTFNRISFEKGIVMERVSSEEVLRLLDYPSYFDLLELPLPDGRQAILQYLREEELIIPCEAGAWNITNLSAVLFAKDLKKFSTLKRKVMRVIQYRGKGRVQTYKELESDKGYANGFESLINYIMALIPGNEVINQALRKSIPIFPELAVRELVANALIHQDFSIQGTGPMVEIFDDRIEITNPGMPLVDTEQFVNTPPKSRNEALASLMRRFRICEERGSGIDKVVFQIELFQLPAPIFEVPGEFTRTVLFSHKPLLEMDKTERVRACYLHACLKYAMRDYLTNSSLRERFGVEERNKATVSRYIKEAVEAGAIKPYDGDAAPKLRKYVPYWV
ncbi:ATP-binding protein [Leptolyngbya sp. AN03gr2]|uniref:ATP-binding protein n=1 Tax=unclassified Leptolyngbya TaxID=2650499 RepID=UPI003D317AD8